MARIVLVHGALGGRRCWEPVLPGLRAAGHEVEAIDLPGQGEDDTPVGRDHARSLRAARVRGAGRRAAGGAGRPQHGRHGDHPGRGAAARSGSRGSCTWRRSCPSDGQSLIDITQLPEAAGDQVQANLVVEGDPPVATMPPEAARASRDPLLRRRAGGVGARARGTAAGGAVHATRCAGRAGARGVRRAPARVRDVPAGPGDPPAAAAADARARRLRSGDRDRHRPRPDAVAHRRDARGARPARPVARAGGRPGRLTPI